jgi:riboflavin transporter FmnP
MNSKTSLKKSNIPTAKGSRYYIRRLTVTAILAALGTVLQIFNFPVPFMPSFIKLDFADLPALLASFALGPVSGVAVCFIKNLLDLLLTGVGQTYGIGPLSNFLLGTAFVFTAGIIYKYHPTRKRAIIGAVTGAVTMALVSIPENFFIVYPIYISAFFDGDVNVPIKMYNAILEPVTGFRVTSLMQCLIIFNAPFTLLKAMISVIITIFIYKPLSPLLKGVRNSKVA